MFSLYSSTLSLCTSIFPHPTETSQMLNVLFVFPQSVYQLLPPPYRDVWLEWLDSEKAMARDKQDKKDKVHVTWLSLNVESSNRTIFSTSLWNNLFHFSVEQSFPFLCGTIFSISLWNILLHFSVEHSSPLLCGTFFSTSLWNNLFHFSVEHSSPLLCGTFFSTSLWNILLHFSVEQSFPLLCGTFFSTSLWNILLHISVEHSSPHLNGTFFSTSLCLADLLSLS